MILLQPHKDEQNGDKPDQQQDDGWQHDQRSPQRQRARKRLILAELTVSFPKVSHVAHVSEDSGQQKKHAEDHQHQPAACRRLVWHGMAYRVGLRTQFEKGKHGEAEADDRQRRAHDRHQYGSTAIRLR